MWSKTKMSHVGDNEFDKEFSIIYNYKHIYVS